MKRIALSGTLLALFGLAGCGSHVAHPLDGWGTDLDRAMAQARAEQRPLAVLFTADWSPRSRAFLRRTMSDARVTRSMEKFARVHINVGHDRQYGSISLDTVPTLLLTSPDGEERRYDKGDYPVDYLSQQLESLGTWGRLAGWHEDAGEAERAASGGKPLAVLYSAAWDADSREYEDRVIAPNTELLAGKFTLLRLHFNQHRERALAAGIKMPPALVLQGVTAGGSLVIPGKQPSQLLGGFVAGLPGYEQDVTGWSSGGDLAGSASAQSRARPLAIVLDRKAHWESHYFVNSVLASEEVKAELKHFDRLRMEFESARDLAEKFQVKDSEVPCMIVLGRSAGVIRKLLYAGRAGPISREAVVAELRLVQATGP